MPIVVEKVNYTYMAGSTYSYQALRDISFTVEEGEFLGIIGHTGSGKSTLVQHLNGLVQPTSGRVLVDGLDMADKKLRIQGRAKVGMVFQYPEYQLFEETVAKDIAFGPTNMGLAKDEIEERVAEAAEFTGIPESTLEKSPFELSGGQKRRVAIAGVIAMRPEVLILDEPTAGLDPEGCADLLGNIKKYHEKAGATVIMVTHSMEDAARIADRMVVMYDGRIAMDGAPREVFMQASELIGMGLDVPQVTRITYRLRQRGIDLKGPIYTVEQARDAIAALKGGAGRA
jgi:energy-coupling factor transport system ATP-binding protein